MLQWAASLHCLILMLWAILAFLVAMYWYRKGLSLGWGFCASFVLTPLGALLLGVLLPPNVRLRAQRWAPGGRLRRCPACRELIPEPARICPLCYRAVGPNRAARPGREFTIAEEGRGRRAAFVLREHEVEPRAGAHELAWGDRTTTLAPQFPLDLALYIARQKRQRLGPPWAHPPPPIRVCFLDGTVEELP